MLDDPDYCAWIDCTKSKSVELCPVTCNVPTEPGWCQSADCSYPEVKEKCKDTCSHEGIYHHRRCNKRFF